MKILTVMKSETFPVGVLLAPCPDHAAHRVNIKHLSLPLVWTSACLAGLASHADGVRTTASTSSKAICPRPSQLVMLKLPLSPSCWANTSGDYSTNFEAGQRQAWPSTSMATQ